MTDVQEDRHYDECPYCGRHSGLYPGNREESGVFLKCHYCKRYSISGYNAQGRFFEWKQQAIFTPMRDSWWRRLLRRIAG
jgi:hypothetical protein